MLKKQRTEHKTKYKSKYMRKDGITLIALVITIVVLIILASISYMALFGESWNNNKGCRS